MSDDTQAQQPSIPPRRSSEFEPEIGGTAVGGSVETTAPSSDATAAEAGATKKGSRQRPSKAIEAIARDGERAKRPVAKAPRSPRKRARRVVPEQATPLNESVQDMENSIEGSSVRVLADEDHQVSAAAAAAGESASKGAGPHAGAEPVPTSPIRRPGGLRAWLVNMWSSRTSLVVENPEGFAKPRAVPSAARTGFVISDPSSVVPEAVARRFLKVEHDYYFLDRTPAFSDRGNKLAMRGAHPEVVRSLIEIAKARDWGSITVKGTAQFKQSAWLQAAQRGMTVVGYQPTPLDLAELARVPATNSVEQSLVKGKEYPKGQKGADAEHGNSDQPSKSTPTSKRRVAPTQASTADAELLKKADAFAKNKPSFVIKKYPDLAGAYGVVEAAKTFADERLPAAAREFFVEIARRHMREKIVAGEIINGPKVLVESSKVHGRSVQGKKLDGLANERKVPSQTEERVQEK